MGARLQVQQAIVADADGPPWSSWAGQNIAAAAMLLRNLPELAHPQQQELHHNIRMLVEHATVQLVESSTSRHWLAAATPSFHQQQGRPP
jgi:hypothetical protein